MKVKILIFGTLFLIGNVTIAAYEFTPRTLSTSEKNSQSYIKKGIVNDLKEHLVNRGIDEAYAAELANEMFGNDEIIAALTIEHYVLAIEGVSYSDVIEQLASRALLKKNSDLGNYDTLVALTQALKGHNIDPETFKTLSIVASMNQSLQRKDS